VRNRFPRIYGTCQQYGVDIGADLIPVRPAVHYSMGGVKTDLHGRTNLPGLYAAGETAATGVHGANRLASNSLLEGLVFGARAGKIMRQQAGASASPPEKEAACTEHGSYAKAHLADVADLTERVRGVLWRDVGIIRNAHHLKHALDELAAMELAPPPADAPRAEHELYNVWTLGLLIARAALAREESRGSHYRSDFPYRDDERFARHSHIGRNKKLWFE
jgi:L-aspartate oxidase